jgi:hypothetical protein
VAIRRLIVLAATCVFAKQSLEPILCGLLLLSAAWTDHIPEAPLLPKLRGHFAEFLFHGSLEHLRLLASPTCVGLRYGHTVHSPTGLFSAASSTALGQVRRPNTRRPVSSITLFSPGPDYSVASGRPAPDGSFASAAPRGSTHTARHGNLRPFPIAYASRPRLRGRLTRSG